MQTYKVKKGDTLSKIAERFLGSAGKWSILAEANELVDPNRIRVGQVLVIPGTTSTPAPTVLNPAVTPPLDTPIEEVTFSVENKRVYAVSETTREKIYLGSLFRKGLFRPGRFEPEDMIADRPELLRNVHLSDSEINMLLSTSENEGNLDAINTWDNAYLSFGIFQWTSGATGKAGELPTLLAMVKKNYPDEFDSYWGRFGLDVKDVHGTTGKFTLDGQELRTQAQKNKLRDYAWVLRFARAGSDRKVQSIEVLHAIHRLDGFYYSPESRLSGHSLSEIITSEYGAALLLDNHVNRPAFVVPCIARALGEAGVTAESAVHGNDASEKRILNHYLKIRETHGGSSRMTNAAGRAEITRRYVQRGVISDRRGSFQGNRDRRSQA